jgi:hypothetical protein
VVTNQGPEHGPATPLPEDERLDEAERARWQIVAGHMAFVLDPKQAAMLAAEAN